MKRFVFFRIYKKFLECIYKKLSYNKNRINKQINKFNQIYSKKYKSLRGLTDFEMSLFSLWTYNNFFKYLNI